MGESEGSDGANLNRRRELASGGALTIEETMSFLKLGRTEVYARINAGDLLTAKLGRRRLVLRRSAEELLARHIVSAD
jgi:hypothetical protein